MSAGSWSTSTTRCGVAPGRSASTPPRTRRCTRSTARTTTAHDDGTGDALWEVVQTLPRKARAVVVLRYYEELSEAETAAVLGISVGTVKSQTSRALAALRARAPQTMNPRVSEEDDLS